MARAICRSLSLGFLGFKNETEMREKGAAVGSGRMTGTLFGFSSQGSIVAMPDLEVKAPHTVLGFQSTGC